MYISLGCAALLMNWVNRQLLSLNQFEQILVVAKKKTLELLDQNKTPKESTDYSYKMEVNLSFES